MNRNLLSLCFGMLVMTPPLYVFSEEKPTAMPPPAANQHIEFGDGTVVIATTSLNGVSGPPIVGVAQVGKMATLTTGADGKVRVDGGIVFNDGKAGIDPENLRALIHKQRAELQAAEFSEIKSQLGMSAEEFDAITPLLAAVENLRTQQGLFDRKSGIATKNKAAKTNAGMPSNYFSPQILLGTLPLDPAMAEIQNAAQSLRILVEDKQANASQFTNGVALLHHARDQFAAKLTKARNDLRAVLTTRQEALLITRGTLD